MIPQLCCYRFGLLADFPQCTENFLSTSPFMCLYTTAASSNLWFFFRVRNGEFSLFFFPLPNRRQWGQRSTLVMHHFQQHKTDFYPKLYFSIVKRSRVGMHELEVENGDIIWGRARALQLYFSTESSGWVWLSESLGFLRSNRVQGLQSAPCSPLDVPHSPYILIRKRNRKTQF